MASEDRTLLDGASRVHNTYELEFHQAMTDFNIMFPDFELNVIEAILRSNGGAVDATIDQL